MTFREVQLSRFSKVPTDGPLWKGSLECHLGKVKGTDMVLEMYLPGKGAFLEDCPEHSFRYRSDMGIQDIINGHILVIDGRSYLILSSYGTCESLCVLMEPCRVSPRVHAFVREIRLRDRYFRLAIKAGSKRKRGSFLRKARKRESRIRNMDWDIGTRPISSFE